MSEAPKSHTGGDSHPEARKTNWENFGHYKDEETGVQFIVQKARGTFSPKVGFTHSKTGDFTSYGRKSPSYSEDLDKFDLLDDVIKGLQNIQRAGVANAEARAAAKADREAHIARQARRDEKSRERIEQKKAAMRTKTTRHTT